MPKVFKLNLKSKDQDFINESPAAPKLLDDIKKPGVKIPATAKKIFEEEKKSTSTGIKKTEEEKKGGVKSAAITKKQTDAAPKAPASNSGAGLSGDLSQDPVAQSLKDRE